MLDHLILNTKKWFEISDSDTSIVANGKTWSPHPATVTVRQGGVIGGANGSAISIGRSTFRCVGTANNYYAITGTANRNGQWEDLPDTFPIYLSCVSASDVESVNWGGKFLPIRLYQRLRSLFTCLGRWLYD